MAGWTPKDYTPFFLFDEPTHTPKEIRAEYTRQRDIAMKRANRLEAAGLSVQAEYMREIFPTHVDMAAEIERIIKENETLPPQKRRRVPTVGDYLRRGKEVLNQAAYSLSGIKNIQRAIQEETGEIVPLGDVLPFDEYMRSWRLSAFKQLVRSDLAVDLYGDDYQEIGGTFSDFYTLYQSM